MTYDHDRWVRTHLEQVSDWLDQNVKHYPSPKKVTLSNFDVDWDELSGTLRIALDDIPLEEEFRFGLEASGRVQLYFPMFHSPLGAPASYPKVELTDETRQAILSGLHQTIPRIKPCGIDRETVTEIHTYMPVSERIKDVDEFSAAIQKVQSENYSISVSVV